MSKHPGQDEEGLFKEALRLPTDSERRAFIHQNCADDPVLLSRVIALLDAHESRHVILDILKPDDDGDLPISEVSERPGTVIGRYKLLQKIGEGGMAVVYMAEQEQPIRRKVALKIIKLGMDTRQVIARFEAERQALAMMDHPNIAKVFDGGATETGRPYFVMELVTGVSITEYCDQNQLSTKERLKLFIQVCHGFQHAHQKGIIHRDIKPTNVLVTKHDGEPLPKIIDFGISKATNQRLTEKTLFTRYAHIIGTPAYMSPEQAELSDMDVDTRSDIYSLGILLYELLTGATPFSEEELRKAGYIEMQRVIREEEPAKPSTKLSTLGKTLTDVAKCRRSTPDLLSKAIRGDLDWIVMRALEKARDRRYDTVSALASDVRRHLTDEPIIARAPGIVYRLQKYLRRHRSWSAIAMVVVILLGALTIALTMWIQNRRQLMETESIAHENILAQARWLYSTEDYARTLRSVRSILDSKHVGGEARLLHDIIVTNARKQMNHYAGKIQADPKDANSYLHRAQYHLCLDNKHEARADMDQYRAILNPPRGTDAYDDWFVALVSQEAPSGLFFGTPENLGPVVNSSDFEWFPRISADGLSLYFMRNLDRWENWLATRATQDDAWDTAVRLKPPTRPMKYDPSDSVAFVFERQNIAAIFASFDVMPGLTTMDGLEIYGWDGRPTWGHEWADIFVMRRERIGSPWTDPCNIGPVVNTDYMECAMSISSDGLELYYSDNEHPRPDGYGQADLWMTRRISRDDLWQEPRNLGPQVNSSAIDALPHISSDGMLLFFGSNRGGGYRQSDLYVARRTTASDVWGQVRNLGPRVNAAGSESNPCISADGRTLYFVRNKDLWQVPIVYFEGDPALNDATSQRAESRRDHSGREVVPRIDP